MLAFEADLYQLAKNIKFRYVRNQFQTKLVEDVKCIKNSEHMFVPADKSTNLYKVSPIQYKKLLSNSITTSYQKIKDDSILDEIDKEAKKIAQYLKLEDRIECFPHREAFITLTDHKENFHSKPSCRLINPAKSELGKIAKFHIDKINKIIRAKTKLRQWRSTKEVIAWFESLKNKQNCKFIKFDIAEFYPSISESLVQKALNFAQKFTEIDQELIDLIMHSRKSVLFEQNQVWVKKGGNLFDVTMGSFDGAEICELVGLYLLHNLCNPSLNAELGLYRDDGLAVVRNASGPILDKIKKKIIKIFQQHNLKITTEANLIQTDFLDVTFNLDTGKYWPYRKPENQPLYINTKSNHPPPIKKQLPHMIASRISQNSSDINEFQKAKSIYEYALKKSGYDENLQYASKPNLNNTTRVHENGKSYGSTFPSTAPLAPTLVKSFLNYWTSISPSTTSSTKFATGTTSN